MIAPDTLQNAFFATFFLITHNAMAILLFVGLIVFTALAIWRPKRSLIFLMIGCAMLLLAFEYQKHIQQSLLEQTLQSLITERQSFRIERVITLTINRIIPFGLQAGGFLFSFLGIVHLVKNRERKV